MNDKGHITIYTDGGAKPNPGPGGWGAVLLLPGGERKELSGGEARTTNNRMELTAAIRALEAVAEGAGVTIVTDSQYLKRGVTEWLPGWIARGWQRKAGELQNEDLWRRLAELLRRHRIDWRWVRGHAGHRHNERADQLATAARRQLAGGKKGGGGTDQAGEAPRADVRVLLKVSCNDGRGGWAARLWRADDEGEEGEEEEILTGGATGTTANQLDLEGAARVLESLPLGTRVAFHTASGYLRDGASSWLAGWRRRGWRTASGSPVQNREAWQRLDRAMGSRRVRWLAPAEEDREEGRRLEKLAREAAEA